MFFVRSAAVIAALSMAMPAIAQEAAEADAEAPATAETIDVTADTVLATVNGQEITLGHMILARAELPQEYQQIPPDALYEGLLEQLIQQAAVATMAGDLSSRGEMALENERRTLLVNDVVVAAMEEALTEETLRAAYDESVAGMEPEDEFSAAHILVETEEEAADLKSQIDGGADFAELAKEHSTGPSGPNGGDLGWFGKGMMVPEFEEAVLALEPGQVSDPVQTQFGWHVVKLNEVRQKDAPAFAEVQAQLAQQIQQETIQKIIEEATAAATIERVTTVPPAAVNDTSLLND